MTLRLAAVAVLVTVAGCTATAPVVPPPLAATAERNAAAMASLSAFVGRCQTGGCALPVGAGVAVDTVVVEGGVVVARFSRDLGDSPVRTASAGAFEREVAQAVRGVYPGLPVRVETRGGPLAALVPNAERAPAERDAARRFPRSQVPALVRPADADRQPDAGLAGRHVALWPSHGWLYNADTDGWGWQRPRLFTTVEDLLTVAFVTRELAPMLERAGAVTLLPRERDPQPTGVIVDDADAAFSGRWDEGPPGFGVRETYGDGVNPFRLGTTRTTASGSATWAATLAPGSHAVHVSYADGSDRSDAARYTVRHAGGETEVLVNQQIGGGTWVYLGTFEFDGPASVTLAARDGVVSADAVRFGGGTGIVAREGQTSGRPRWLEASRYYQQFAGAPPFVYNVSGEPDEDYVDDYRSRGEWVNWLRGAPFGPTGRRDEPGLGIPVDLSLAWHTDAGIDRDGVVGTLAIYDVPGMDSTRTFPNGVSRLANRDLADAVQSEIVGDLSALYRTDWNRRQLWDRNYSEAARPAVPGLLLELLSHQNYRDMRFALDPRVQFDAARAVYKGVGRFFAEQSGERFVPQPLRPTHLALTLENGGARLRWRPQTDPVDPDAEPTGYVVYRRTGDYGWHEVARTTEPTALLTSAASGPGAGVTSYRVAAVNAGGESRPSAALAVGMRGPGATVLVVDGFDRVAPPDAVSRPGHVGFVDAVGVPEGLGVVAAGPQVEFDPSEAYVSDAAPGWGASRGTLEGTAILGNTRDHAAAHGAAWLANGRPFVSASAEAVEAGLVDLSAYEIVDLALGLERRTAWPDPDDPRPPAFEALPDALRQRLGAFLDGGGALVVSGSGWAADAASDPASARFLARLGVARVGLAVPADGVVSSPDGSVRAAFATDYGPDVLAAPTLASFDPGPGARVVLTDAATRPVGVATGRTVALGVPLVSVPNPEGRAALVRLALAALNL